jgi:glycerol-3-phosphate dehydrogenase
MTPELYPAALRYSLRVHDIAIVGGGINGCGIAWELARRGYAVTLFERGACGAETSSATTKLIHGGIRYLEHLDVGLVREALRERAWLLKKLPALVKPIEITLPLYDDSTRRAAILRAGLTLYDLLAGTKNIGRHRRLDVHEVLQRGPLRPEGLRGGFSFYDAQVDDYELVRAVVRSARRDGATILEHAEASVMPSDTRGKWLVGANGTEREFDLVINAAGPWMNELIRRNHLPTQFSLSLVRGSHLVLRRRVSDYGFLLQSTADRRVFFVLPWKETTLVGTTEVVQREPVGRIEASSEEIDYLIERFNDYFDPGIARSEVQRTYAGVRPLIGRSRDPGAITREYRIEVEGTLINIYGGKLTTFMALARKVAGKVDAVFGEERVAREAEFAE